MLRFAPTPNGDMHIDNLRIALLNYIVAKKNNDLFLLRIEDIDKDTIIEGKDAEIIDILKKFSIKEDQKIYQSENIKTYQQFAKKLILNGKAYFCFCSKDNNSCNCLNLTQQEIQNKLDNKEKYIIVAKEPNNPITFKDKLQGDLTYKANSIGKITLIEENSNPTYDFACAIDDMLEGITTIIREEKYLDNTPKQIYIQTLFDYKEQIEYIHVPSLNIEKSITIKWLFEQGFLPDAIINYILSLGFKAPENLFYLPDAIKWYDISNISKYPVKFDINELRNINKEHLKKFDNKKLSSIFGFADSNIGELLKLFLNLEDVSTINELEAKFKLIFSKKECSSSEYKKDLQNLSQLILKAPMIESFKEFKEYLLQKSKLSNEHICKLLYILLLGQESTIELEKVYPLIKSYILEVARCQ